MHNELTKIDLKKMREELDYRRITLRPQLLEEVKVARSFGDLSENFEYKAAKQEKNRNESRIRYLENMIKTARIIEDHSDSDTVGLYDKVTIWLEEDEEEETWQVVTTVRQDVSRGLISKESPMGSALMGRKIGDRFLVQVNKNFGYWAQVRAIEKGQDDGSAELNRF
ncbi:MAG: transcription elongation factor GreA [Lawsonibacter sp.]|nr:transcription elongation factor GreA [Lawsonibacter sp.]MCI9028385.1 transcription elongation factor GreA [Lawsonibacter sp.]